MTDELVHYALADAVATITLDSPHNRNALSRQLVTELFERLERAGADPDVKVVLLRQEGVLYERYQAWQRGGLSYKNARRNVARDIATVLWAMWKSGADYDERLIGGRPVGVE